MHNWIQYHILAELTRNSTRHYSQLRPGNVEGNLFTYHLNGLLRDGLVEKTNREYQLTSKGQQLVQTLSLTTGRIRKQPQILTAIICKNQAGEYLLSRWKRQPNIGLVSFPHGMVHFGTPIMDMATQELAEKTGLNADLLYRGDIYIRYASKDSDEVKHHRLVHLFKATNPRPSRELRQRSDTSEPFWAKLSDICPADFVPGFYEVAQLAEQQTTGTIFADLLIK